MKRILRLKNRILFENKQSEAYTDYLTKLANRHGLYDYYNNLPKEMLMHFMFIDIDNFKRVNDVYGHGMGDELLIKVGQLIKEKLPGSFVSRIGGDEFVAVIDGTADHTTVTNQAQSLIDGMQDMDFRKDILSLISFSIGIILDQKTSQILDDVLYKCDSAMYNAKTNGKNHYVVYYALEKSVEISKTIESEQEKALNSGEFHVYFQPRVNMLTANVSGAEALVRWEHPVDGLRSPDMFLPLFEKNGFIKKLDMFVYKKVCAVKASWKGKPYEHLMLSVNLSRLHLYQADLPEYLLSIAEEYDIPANEINFELKENVFIKDSMELSKMTDRLRNVGFHVSIDNFGSGYSALNMLKDISVDYINIDKDFIQTSSYDTKGQRVLKNVFVMCKDLKFNVVAVGIESELQAQFAIGCGCEMAQGDYYCKTISPDDFEKYLEANFFDDSGAVRFSFNDNFKSDCGKFRGRFIGSGYSFGDGVVTGQRSIRFPGGEHNTNYLNLPNTLIHHESYTVSMWIRPEISHLWSAAIYVKYESGFFSYYPTAWEGHTASRIRDARIINGFYDVSAATLPLNTWTHVAISFNAKTEQANLYINGHFIGHRDNMPILYFVTHIMLGGDIYQDSFKGSIAELVIFNNTKTPSEIEELFMETAGRDDFIYKEQMVGRTASDLFFKEN